MACLPVFWHLSLMSLTNTPFIALSKLAIRQEAPVSEGYYTSTLASCRVSAGAKVTIRVLKGQEVINTLDLVVH